MKINNVLASFTALLSVATVLLTAAPAAHAIRATEINFTTLRDGSESDDFNGMAVDPATGKVYERTTYDASTKVLVYANVAAFAARTPSSTLTLSAPTYGAYFAVSNGQLYARTSKVSSAAATFSLSSGAQTSSTSGYTGMGGTNFADTFNWGGYSGVNFMQDASGMYVLGGDAANTNWQIERLGTGLASTSSTTFNANGLGYGFVINGTLFTGASYNSNAVTTSVNLTSGAVSSISDILVGISSNPYMSDFSYDYAADTLYAYNANNSSFYQAANASVQFGVPLAAVPEPATLLLFGLGLTGFALSRRKQRGN